MKKLVFIIMISLTALSMQAQRCAVLEFKAGVGISQNDVDGISAIFITYFRPAGYTMVERTQIDKVIEEQGFQRSNMTQSQMVRVGQILNVSKIVVGDINVVMGQYNVDTRVINVETGTISATEGATFATSSYRSSMQSVSQKLATKIAITPGSTVQPSTSSGPKKRNGVEVLYGYLKIFPNELGVFQAEPTTVISQINAQAQYGYDNWRIPTNEELSLMRANNYLGGGEYMSIENKHGIVLLVTDGKEISTQGWVDLGLPSGTLWKKNNESDNHFFTYEEAKIQFGSSLPTKEQFEELKKYCIWSWSGRSYKVTGPSGEYIDFPTTGFHHCDDKSHIASFGSYGMYWSITSDGSERAYALRIYAPTTNNISVFVATDERCYGGPVRLIHK